MNILLDISTIEKFDTQKMYAVYDKWPEIAEDAFSNQFLKRNFGKIDHIIFAGMGGSGAIGDIISAIFSKSNVHVNIVKGFLLPQTVNSKSLVITTSISGNTKETLTILNDARKLGCKTIAFSSNGKMKKYCEKYNINHYNIKKCHSPRASFTSFLYSILKVIMPILPLTEKEILESINQLKKTRDIISTSNLSTTNPAIELATWIRFPLIYYPAGLQAAAIRFKNSLQENAKLHVIAEDIVEACHNGIVAWEKKSKMQPILILGRDDYIMTKKRWKVVKSYFQENDIEFREILSVKGNILTKLINLIYVLDYCSIYKSILRKIDPTPVNSIEFIKERI